MRSNIERSRNLLISLEDYDLSYSEYVLSQHRCGNSAPASMIYRETRDIISSLTRYRPCIFALIRV